MESIRLLDYKDWRFSSNNKIKIELTINSFKALKDIRFCLHLTSLEGQVISILQSSKTIDFKENESITIPLEKDLSILKSGQYCFAPELYCISEYGTRFSHQNLGMVITFEIIKEENVIDNLRLDNYKSGYVKFPDLIDLRK